MGTMREFVALIRHEADDAYRVSFPDLPNVVAAGGATRDAARRYRQA
jgi:predicted RNase H-like HicB family nuclease